MRESETQLRAGRWVRLETASVRAGKRPQHGSSSIISHGDGKDTEKIVDSTLRANILPNLRKRTPSRVGLRESFDNGVVEPRTRLRTVASSRSEI